MTRKVPVVDYLVLDDGDPHLVAHACEACGARFLERHNGCARCGGTSFRRARLATTGRLRSFTIVHRAPPGIETPFISCTVELDDGGVVAGNLRELDPDPALVAARMPVRLVTFTCGTDAAGTEAVAFGFVPDTGEGPGPEDPQ